MSTMTAYARPLAPVAPAPRRHFEDQFGDHFAQRNNWSVSANCIESAREADGDSAPAFNVDDDIVQQALQIIWSPTRQAIGVYDIARKLPVTRRTLDRRFSAAMGRSVLEEINNCRLTRAKRLLSETDLPVKTVSYLAGFPSRERMRLLFLAELGMTPSDYRVQMQESEATSSFAVVAHN